ncbi:MAG: YkgJ family cysteine cluster protein [Desulfobacula sp.]|uniref:YkgJ family cysteine cluster protein n=1 Tax=Desulfobacula sp. TaxID=2593537 RepID=UPI0025BE6AC2|nr:YkgJ family cysteine cluster protein [Desulfobacula sp.]MCD4721486.1 YkgJ family cysteine cluster protein [Desulfobacula sp.]
MTEDMIPIRLEDLMNFNCNFENECFNDCCRDLNQALTPYDVLRLKNNLGISSQDFLKTYTFLHYGPGSGLPVIEFKPNPGTGYACPFVTPEGCSVYEDRPGSCRMYPLARAIARSRQTGEITQYFALIEESHCKGFGKKTGQTVKEWLKGQDVDKHNKENDRLMELISLKNRIIPGKLEGAQSDMFYLGLYDLDEFRAQIIGKDLLKEFSLPEDLLKKIKTDDEALLNFGVDWVKFMLFGIKATFGE